MAARLVEVTPSAWHALRVKRMNHCRRTSRAAAIVALVTCSTTKAAPAVPVIKALSPTDSIAATQLPSGYRLEPVLTEPDIAEPVMIAFDGNGRMYVAEMRTYMQDADVSMQARRTRMTSRRSGRSRLPSHAPTSTAEGLRR